MSSKNELNAPHYQMTEDSFPSKPYCFNETKGTWLFILGYSHEGVFKVKGKKHNCLKILFSLNLRVLTSGGKMENVDRHWWESFGLV